MIGSLNRNQLTSQCLVCLFQAQLKVKTVTLTIVLNKLVTEKQGVWEFTLTRNPKSPLQQLLCESSKHIKWYKMIVQVVDLTDCTV